MIGDKTPYIQGSTSILAGAYVLELGCGQGLGMEILLATGETHMIGIDVDSRLATWAHQGRPSYGDRASVLVGTPTALSIADASIDIVIAYAMLYQCPDWQQTLQEIVRILTPTGSFYFEDLLNDGHTPLPTLFHRSQSRPFTAATLRAGFETAGFHICQWRQIGPWIVVGHAQLTPVPSSDPEFPSQTYDQ